MGLTHVRVTVRNPADTERCWEGDFLVDTGAIDPLVPRQHLEAIGVRPRGRRTYSLADGTKLGMDVGVAQLELLGDLIGSTVVFGPENSEPLLGVTALESLGIEVDPTNQQLRRQPSIRLKGAGGPPAWPASSVEAPPPNSREPSGPRDLGHDAGAAWTPEPSPSAALGPRASRRGPETAGIPRRPGKAALPPGVRPEAEEAVP